MKLRSSLVMLVCVLATGHGNPAIAAPLGTAFTYQGQLIQSGSPVTNTADFQFTLWDALSAGIQVAGPTSVNNVSVTNGQFTASIDFGAIVFNGDARWLQIAVRSPAGSGTFTTLSPRQPLTAVPYALQTRGLFINAANNVGIGTTAPARPFHVFNNALVPARFESNHPTAAVVEFRNTGSNANWEYTVTGTSPPFGEPVGSMYIHKQGNGIPGLIITPDNRVGLGTVPSSLAKLHVTGDVIAGAPGQEWFFHTRSSFGGDFLHITDNDGGSPQFQRGLSINQNGIITSRGELHFYNTASSLVGAINPDPPPGSTTFPAGTPTMRAGAISMFGPAGRTRFGVWSRDTNFGGTWFPNQAHMFMDAADGSRVISIYTAGESGASGNIVCTNFLATGSKNFLVPNPDNPKEDITYACLEGPECGMYMRGTAELIDGQATVRLPATFSSLASQEGLTVILTPLSGDSLGLACVNRTIHGFDVVELMKGDGHYEFDWEVKAIRRGTRDYKVVHPWTEHASGDGAESEVWERRMADIERRNAKFAQEDAEIGPRPDSRPVPLLVAD
jgi:hypothetical protein